MKQQGRFAWLVISLWVLSLASALAGTNAGEAVKDSVAERMLLYQRDNGGWPQPGGNAINYKLPIAAALKTRLVAEKGKLDTTIDDQATTNEIKYLVKAYQETGNEAYREAAERGIRYLLAAQNAAGGWPQSYPDSSSYHKHITYNDHAMTDVLWVLTYLAEGSNGFSVVDKTLLPRAQRAIQRGVDCILKTQVRQNGKLTAWCAQHDSHTLKPANARKFELASLSGNESVSILNYLMHLPNPSPEIKRAIEAGAAWLESVKLTGIAIKTVEDANQPKGKDRVVVASSGAVTWARFYELDTDKPIFCGRDGIKRYALAEIENERRVGYAWYGNWPAQFLMNDYPAWVVKWKDK
ncbi:pectate lyase [Tellurirhabdus bombi]|uniref:pectate lyase n=1 Tax=Tellurirhabdus bombi TaxID=2907205 RepID=UPI001F2EE1B8|nr:pectate lyase [Tellurirhabdus bombi]